uniref:Triggering receptor expressed on myeloid cells 2 n=1 Tax=Pseudonaja textilis TaxID=8673 RepID=A0A670ZGT2_PSETE
LQPLSLVKQSICLVTMSTAEIITEVSGVEGGPISINCSYSPQKNQWREKSWCKHISEATCQHVVSARRFWLPFLKRRNGTTAIADNIQEGVLMVTINPLQKQDAGWYQCMTNFLGTVKTLQKVKVNVLTSKSLVLNLFCVIFKIIGFVVTNPDFNEALTCCARGENYGHFIHPESFTASLGKTICTFFIHSAAECAIQH